MLTKYRSEIDLIDDEIIKLLDMRLEIVHLVGEYKKVNDVKVLDQSREQVIIDKINQMDIKNKKEVILIYQAMMEITKDMQR